MAREIPTIVNIYPLSVDAKGTIAKDRIGTTIKEEYRVVSNTTHSNGAEILNYITTEKNLALGDPYPGSTNAVLKSISAKRTGSDRQAGGPFVWNVSLEYAPVDQTDKKNEEAKISVSTETNDETDGRYDRTKPNPQLNINSAGDFFEDKLPLKNVLVIFRYTLNYIDNPNQNIIGVVWHTNSAPWHGLPKGTCLVRSFSTDRQKDEEGFYFWSTSIEIAYNPNGWTYQKADCGFYDNDGRILDDQGAPVEKAQLLDGEGNRSQSGNPVLLPFTLYEETNFSQMNLPDPFAGNPTS